MSDNSNSTGSTGSSTNSWTLLSPEEAAVESVGPVDDGTESLGDVPSLSEELAGAAAEFKPADIPVETILSEEGHQICQETSPESSLGPIPSSPSRLSPSPSHLLDPSEVDLESQPPVIHDIVTSSPSDNDHLGAVPFVTNIDLGTPLDIPACELLPSEPEESGPDVPAPAEPAFDTPADTAPITTPAEESPALSTEAEVNVPAETLAAADSSSHVEADTDLAQESPEAPSSVPESDVTQCPIDKSPAPAEAAGASAVEEGETEPCEAVTQDVEEEEEEEEEEEQEPSSSFEYGDTISHDDDGLRRRHAPAFEALRPRTSDEEDEEEEVEFKLAEKKKEEKPWFSVNTCIAGALVLLFLGSLFLSGDFDASEVSDGEQSQDWLSGDPQDMKELLDKLTQEKQQIVQLETQLQSQKEELDAALKAVAVSGDEKGKADLEKENVKLKEELSSLPDLKAELEALRARVTELSQLTAPKEMPTSTPVLQPDASDDQNLPEPNQNTAGPERKKDAAEGVRVKEELQRQKVLLEESRKRLEGMRKGGGGRRHVRDNLVEIQKKLSEQVERWGQKRPQESKRRGNWKRDEKKEQRGDKERKHGRDGGRKDKDERRTPKQSSHKESWRKHQDEWERKKDERRMDREERRKEKPWHSKHDKSLHSHHQHHQHHQHHHHHHHQQQLHDHNDFWRDQEQKLRRNIRPQLGCRSVDDCAAREGLYPVELSEFEELLEGYLSQLRGPASDGRDKVRKLTADFFEDGVFIHDRVLFSDFAEDVADILEDTVDVLGDDGQRDDDSLEEEMEEFEREALWKFSASA